jgi:FkbM family methyltransferase
LKKIHNSFSWYPSPTWWWPSHDDKLAQVNDWVRDADVALKHIDKRDICVQAGGACGVWPAYLAQHFKRVITFEPVKTNAECLKLNVKGIKNVSFLPCGLSDKKEVLRINLDDSEINNCGAYYCSKEGEKIPVITIDSLKLKACSFIALDVEGMEKNALMGAKDTIDKFSPVVMIEEKPLPHMHPGDHLKARVYLESIGYKQVDAIHRDVVFKR